VRKSGNCPCCIVWNQGTVYIPPLLSPFPSLLQAKVAEPCKSGGERVGKVDWHRKHLRHLPHSPSVPRSWRVFNLRFVMAQAATLCPPGLGRCRAVEHERFLLRKPQGISRHVSRQGKAAIAASRQPMAGAGESVLIAGGGPAGLCAAMVLANRGYKGITVVEKRESPQDADPLRSFSYSIDER